MKPYFYLLFLLSFSLVAQNKDAQKRLYYNLMDKDKQVYAMGKYQLELIPYDEVFDSLVVKRNLVDFAKKNHFTDTIVKKNPKLPYPHYYLPYYKKNKEDHWQNTMVYYIGKNTDKGKWSFIATISSVAEKPFEEIDTEMIQLILEKKVLNENHLGGRFFNFLGRKVPLMDECYWQGVNIVRCPTKGEMNWSLHPSLAEAQLSLRLQKEWGDMIPLEPNYTYNRTSEQQKTLIFEGKPSQVTEVIYNVRYQDPVLKSYHKDTKLIVYYIATIVRGQAIACVISYWDYNERLPDTGLPEFVSQFVRLPKGA